jgi:hypothetical protein
VVWVVVLMMVSNGLGRGLNFYGFKVGLGNAAVWALPGLRHIPPQGTGRNAVFWAASGLVVHKAANNAQVCLHGDSLFYLVEMF